MAEIPKLPEFPKPIAVPMYYANERVVNGVRYLYYRQYRCTVESWENDAYPKWELIKRPRKTKQPNL